MLLGAYMWRGRSYDVSHKAGALLEVDSDVDVVASSGMCVGVCVCAYVLGLSLLSRPRPR